jgi:hypothetical protein
MDRFFDRVVQTFTGEKRPEQDFWVDSSKCKACYECETAFSVFVRRHHCRICGRIFCGSCSNNFIPASRDSPDQSWLRVCNYCGSPRPRRAHIRALCIAPRPPPRPLPPWTRARAEAHGGGRDGMAPSSAPSPLPPLRPAGHRVRQRNAIISSKGVGQPHGTRPGNISGAGFGFGGSLPPRAVEQAHRWAGGPAAGAGGAGRRARRAARGVQGPGIQVARQQPGGAARRRPAGPPAGWTRRGERPPSEPPAAPPLPRRRSAAEMSLAPNSIKDWSRVPPPLAPNMGMQRGAGDSVSGARTARPGRAPRDPAQAKARQLAAGGSAPGCTQPPGRRTWRSRAAAPAACRCRG